MNENENIITIEDEIKEFSDKPVKSSALFKALEEKGVPDSSEASVGDVLTKGEGGVGWETPSGGGGGIMTTHLTELPPPSGGVSCDKTYAEIRAELDKGAPVMAIDESGRIGFWYEQTGSSIICVMIGYETSSLLGAYIYTYSSSSLTMADKTISMS